MNLFAAADAMLPTDAEINSLMRGDLGDNAVHPLLQGGMFSVVKGGRRIIHRHRGVDGKLKVVVEYAGGREMQLCYYADKLFPLPPPEAPYNEELDAVHPSIEDSGRPGTAERIAAYRDWYNSQPTGECNPLSPNEGILDEDMEAEQFIINVLSLKPGKNDKNETILRDWMFKVASETHHEALNAE